MPSSLPKRRIFTNNSLFFANYDDLQKGDIFIGRLRIKPGEEFILLDLEARGIKLFPSGLSQHLSRSKVMQTKLLAEFMLPHSMVIFNQHDMLTAVNHYGHHNIKKVITKDDRRNAGMGILQWQSVEDVFNQAVLGVLPYPFVLQPFIADCKDIRVIVLGDYWESYERHNPDNFRNNIHCGGNSRIEHLDNAQKLLCKMVMARGKFTYAHIDLMITPEKTSYLAEINLRGGIKGAKIDPAAYNKKIEDIIDGYQQGLKQKKANDI